MDLAMFDIFRGAGADKDALWLEAVSGLANVQRRTEEIAAGELGQYSVFSAKSVDCCPHRYAKVQFAIART